MCRESQGEKKKKRSPNEIRLRDIESSSLFQSLPLFISVSRHLRAQGQRKSTYQRDHCSLSLALRKYSSYWELTPLKKWDVLFFAFIVLTVRSLLVIESYQSFSDDAKWKVRYPHVRFPFCFFSFLSSPQEMFIYDGASSPSWPLKTKEFTLFLKDHIWRTKTILHTLVYSFFPFQVKG